MAAAAVDNRNSSRPSACLDDPNFATICSFIDKFGQACNLGDLPFDYLQEMLENTDEGKKIKALRNLPCLSS